MAIFNNMSITNRGQLLYAKAQAGRELRFTKMMVGSGQIENRNPATLLDLIDPRFSIGIQSITPNTELKTATISATITNNEVSEAVYICEIGLYADDPDEGEILYAYGSAGTYGDYYAPASQGAYSWNYQINAAIGNASNVTVELSNLAYDYAVINSNTTFVVISGGNQKEINKSIDKKLSEISTQQNTLINDSYPIVEATGTNSYVGSSARIKSVGKGTRCTLFVGTASTGSCSLNLNDKGAVAIKDSNGNVVTNLKANIPYNLCHNGSDFILQGKGGGGNLIPKYLLAGYYGEGDNGRVDGAMINRNAPNVNLNCGGTYNLEEGYYSGGQIVANSLASQTSATSTAAQILAGYSAWVNGVLLNGGMVNRGAVSATLNAGGSYTIPAGYHNGLGKIIAKSLASQSAKQIVIDYFTLNISSSSEVTVNVNCGFQPSQIIVFDYSSTYKASDGVVYMYGDITGNYVLGKNINYHTPNTFVTPTSNGFTFTHNKAAISIKNEYLYFAIN